MNQTALENSTRYCVFRSDDNWFGISALAIRSIIPRPLITPTPISDPLLQGLCHVQNEFVPVISFRSLTNIQYQPTNATESQMLILLGSHGPWGLLIDQAVTLATLETTISDFGDRNDQWSKVTAGSASYQQHVLQVVDPTALYEYGANLLKKFWQNSRDEFTQLI